jgi:hypothetical protein
MRQAQPVSLEFHDDGWKAPPRRAGYRAVFMFGDSVEDGRASRAAQGQVPDGVTFIFVPVIPGAEERCFAEGNKIIRAIADNDLKTAGALSAKLAREFAGKEVTM